MSVESSDRSSLDPDVVAAKSFTRARKGYEVDEVRAFLVGMASQLREARHQRDDLERRLVELERRSTDPRELDEDQVTQLLGEETARVLDTARKAAVEIRTRAETEVARAKEDAARSGRSIREAADEYAAGVRSSADEDIDRRRREADEYAEEVRGSADAEVAAQRAEADVYVQETRDAADTEVAELRVRETGEVERLRSEAESVLAERTAEAETAAGAIRAESEAAATRIREDADRYAEATRAAADAYRTEVQTAGDAYKAEATAEGDRIRSEAKTAAEEIRTAAESASEARRVDSEREANQALSAARDKGRSMVEEARTYRERIIADLAARRRSTQDHLDSLAVARDALAVALTDIGNQITDSRRILGAVVVPASETADLSVDRKALSGDDRVPELVPDERTEPGEVEAPEPGAVEADETAADAEGPSERTDVEVTRTDDPDVGADESDGADPEPDGSAGAAGPKADETTDEVAANTPSSDTGSRTEAAEPSGPVDVGVQTDVEVDTGSAPRSSTEPEPVRAPGPDADPTDATDEGAGPDRVDALFASLRAENAGERSTEQGSVDEGDEPEAAGSATSSAEADRGSEPTTESDTPGESDSEITVADGEESDEPEPGADSDVDLLDRRDAATDAVERQLARRLKRVLSDEQNETLDLLRRTKGTPKAEDVLPDDDAHHERYRAAAMDDLAEAERAGAGFFGGAPHRQADVSDVAGEFATDIQRQIRARLERAFADGGDEQELSERIRACYREWKTQRIADTARHYVLVAFSRGVLEASDDGTSSRWLVDDGDQPCPDCDDNALAGGVTKGEPFPTGDLSPPAHPGCRCLAIPVP